MITGYRIVPLAALILAGCGESPAADSVEPLAIETPEISRDLGLNETAAIDAIKTLGSRWRNLDAMSESRDGYTGGRTLSWAGGDRSAILHILPNNRVWNVRISTGMGDRCGNAREIAGVVPKMIASVVPDFAPTPAELRQLDAGTKKGIESAERGDVSVKTAAGCVTTLDIRHRQS